MKILSPITKTNTGSNNLKKSLLKYNYEFHFIGIGDKWDNFMTKLKIVLKFLKNCDDDIYCVVDGYDMLACNYPEKLLETYKNKNIPILFGGEKFCFRYNGIPIKKYKNISFINSRKFLNGGFYMGKKNDLLHMLEWAIKKSLEKNIKDDQKILCLYANTFPDKVGIDLYQEIVFNTITEWDTNSYKIKENILYIKPYNTSPCFIHFPSIKSDGYKRYNKYGKSILGYDFYPIYGEKSWNLLANIPLYFTLFIILNFIVFYFYKMKGILILIIILLGYLKLKL